MSDLMRALRDLRDAIPEYEEAEAYYYGRKEEAFAGSLMRRYFRGTGHRFSVNFAGRPVDALLDRYEITAITADNDAATSVLNQKVWTDNELDLEAPEVLKATSIYGDAYLFVGAGDTDDTVEIFYNSPKTVRVFYDEENPRVKSFAIKAWEIDDINPLGVSVGTLTRVNLYYHNHIEKYVSLRGTKGENDPDFIAFQDDSTDEKGHADNESGEIPFFHFRTARPYGVPEHFKAYGPQDALTKLVINQMTTSDFSVFPQRWAIEDPTLDTQDDIDFADDDTDTPESNGSQFQSGPGTIMLLKSIKAVGEFGAADAENFLKPMNWYVRTMSSICDTPLHYFDPIGDAPSGASHRALEGPLIKKVRTRQVGYTATLREAFRFALDKILGVPVKQVNVQWANPQVIDDVEGWEAVNKKIEAGVPRRQALMEAGYTEAQVNTWGFTAATPNGVANTNDAADAASGGQSDG